MDNVAEPAIGPQTTLAVMQSVPRWLVWQSVPRPGKKPVKVPHYVSGDYRRGTLDTPEDWAQLATYDQAKSYLAGKGDDWGLAFALGPDGSGGHWQGFDLDDIQAKGLDAIADKWATGDLADKAYAELSPSGTGIHVIGYGHAFAPLGANGSGVEAYANGRFFTVTENGIRADGRLTDLSDYVTRQLVQWHGAARSSQASDTVETVPVDAKTVTELRSALSHMPSDDRDLWVRMGMALRVLGKIGEGLWTEWSQKSEKYDPKDAARVWRSLKPTDTGHEAVFAEAQRQGWVNPASNAAQIGASSPTIGRTPLQLLTEDDLAGFPAQRWLVKGIIPNTGFGTLYGQSRTYKSFLALDLLAHIATGQYWFGRKVNPAPAVYVPFEGHGGIPKRVEAWRKARTNQDGHLPSTGMRFITDPLNLRDKADRDELVELLTESGWAGGVLCIDTLAQAGPGIDENTSQGMGEMIAIFQELQHRLGGVVLVIHHSGKSEKAGLRGWSGLIGALDFSLRCWRDDEWPKTDAQLVLDKVKDEQDEQTFDFSVERVVLGHDEDGQEVSSLAVVPPMPRERELPPDEAAIAAGDDAFVYAWAYRVVKAGQRPTGRWLEAELVNVKDQRDLTQKRLRDAIARLKGTGRFLEKPGGPSGAKWLCPIEFPTGEAT